MSGMLTGRSRGWQPRLLVAAGVLLCAAWQPAIGPRSLATVDAPTALWSSVVFVANELPAGLTPPSLDAGHHLVSLIAADIDADGDLDVVANDGSLELLVWRNDGTGHLTRQAPHRSSGWQSEPASPSLDDQRATSIVSVQNDVPSLRLDLRADPIAIAPHRLLRPAFDGPAGSSLVSTRTPRAPPASTRLA